MKKLFLLSALAANIGLCAQNTPNDGVYERKLHQEKQTLGYDFIHEKDVAWSKRVWREIDVQEKQNEVFKYDKQPLMQVLLEAVHRGEIQAFMPTDDQFLVPFRKEEAMSLGTSIDTLICRFACTAEEMLHTRTVVNVIDFEDIQKFRIKEDWFFDEEKGSMEVRILGIAPMQAAYGANDEYLFEAPMFWLYYPDIQEFLTKQEAFNVANDGQRWSWADVFEARLFHSRIIKQSNTQDKRIQDSKIGMNILLEGEQLESEIRYQEHDKKED